MRTPARERYDALVSLAPRLPALPEFAFALAKFTYEIRDGVAVLAEPEPLLHDIWNDETLDPKLPVGSDYWFAKPATDVLVRGSAFAAGGRPFQTSQVSVAIGDRVKRVAVFGRRVVEWSSSGTPSFSAPEPIAEVPLLYQLAYGGLDARVPIPESQAEAYAQVLAEGQAYDHPGLYPRNPVGKGYLALPGPVPELELPNLEDPADLLRPERLIAEGPENWHRQPLPWCFEWMVGLTFPRCCYVGLDAWYPAPDGPQLTEVARGFVPQHFKQRLAQMPELVVGFQQEASLGMVFGSPLAGQRVEILGMHREERSLSFVVPQPPRMEIEVEGSSELVEARLVNLALYPSEKRFTMTYSARNRGLPRLFVPGIHRIIPLAVSVNSDSKIYYDTPLTIRERLGRAAPGGSPS